MYFESGDIYVTDPCFVSKEIADFAHNPTSSPSLTPPPWADVGGTSRLGSDVLARESVASESAKCSDGSQAVVYRRPSTAPSKDYIIYFEGGVFAPGSSPACWSDKSCEAFFEANPHLSGPSASPSSYPPTMPAFEVLSSNPCGNPEFHKHEAIYVPYCTGDMHAVGDVLKAVISELNEVLDDSASRNIVLAGEGPGAVAIVTHMEWIKSTGLNAASYGDLHAILDSYWAPQHPVGELSATSFGTHWGLTSTHSCGTPTSNTDRAPCCTSPTCATSKFQFPPPGIPVLHVEANASCLQAIAAAHELLYSYPHRACPGGSGCSSPLDVKSLVAMEEGDRVIGGGAIARVQESYR